MKEIKNHTAAHLTETNFTVSTTSTTKLAKVVPLGSRYESAKNAAVRDQNTAVIRRHSFDDNGGGYQGL